MTDQKERPLFDMITLDAYGHLGSKIPVHPQPGMFETTVTEEGVDSEWYLESRGRTFGDPKVMNDAITDRMLDDGWEPSEHGCLVKRDKPKPKKARR